MNIISEGRVGNSGWAPCSVLWPPMGEMGAGASSGRGAVPGLWTRGARGREPGLRGARQRLGFPFGSAETVVVMEQGGCGTATLSPSLPKTRLGGADGVGTDPAGSWPLLPRRRRAGDPGTSRASAPRPHGASGYLGQQLRAKQHFGREQGQRVGFPWLQQHCSYRMPSRTLVFGFKI